MLKNCKKGRFFGEKKSGNPETNFIENLREPFFPNLLVSMCANFHEDRSSGLACASDTYIQTHRQTNIRLKIGINPTFVSGCVGRWAVIDDCVSYRTTIHA